MAALKWDEQAQAYVEPQNVPMRYDVDSGAWVETTGMAYDDAAGAWTERWSSEKRLYLYNEGDECTDVTGGWDKTSLIYSKASAMENDGSSLYSGILENFEDANGVVMNQSIDLESYSSLHIQFSMGCTIVGSNPCYGYVNCFSVKPTKWEETARNQVGGESANQPISTAIGVVSSADHAEIVSDISEIKTNAFIAVTANAGWSVNGSKYYNTAYPLWVKYHKIWLEK